MLNSDTVSELEQNKNLLREEAEAELMNELSKGENSSKESGWLTQEKVEKELGLS